MDPRWGHGATAFNARNFFAAHEVWEQLWLDTVGPEKQLLQGLVQIAAGYLKAESGLRSGALKLLSRGCDNVRQCLAPTRRDLEVFVEAVAADIQRLRARPEGANLDLVQPPVLRFDAPVAAAATSPRRA